MDRLQRRNPSSRPRSTSLKPPRGPTIQHPPASRPVPEPSSPDGRQRKKVRFADDGEGGNHHIGGRHVANIREIAKNKPQVCDAKTAEYKFFKKLCEQSGHFSRSYNKHYHQSIEPKISKQRRESYDVTTVRKLSVHGNTVCYDDPPATPAKNEEIHGEQVNAQSSHSEYDDKDTPQFSPHGCLRSIHVLTPIAQTSFDVTGTSGNIDREPVSGQIFSEKRTKLLKMAAKTVSMGSTELLQRRLEFVGDILQRLGAKNIIRKQEGLRHEIIDCGQAPAILKGQSDNLLDYRRRDFNSSTKLRRTGKISSSDASDDKCEFIALPWEHNQGPPSFIDWKNELPRGDSKARECMALPWVCVNDISSSDWKRGISHNQVSNLLLEGVEPYIPRRPASANELSLNVQTALCDQHGWSPMLSVKLAEPFRDRLFFPYQIEEQHQAVPYAISNTSWQPEHHSSTEQCVSISVGLEREDPKEPGLCDNSDARFSSRFDQLPAKSAASSFLDSGNNEILENNDFRYISNFHLSQSNNLVFSANTGCLNSMFSTLEHPYELGAKSLHDSTVGVSCLAGMEEKNSREVLPDNSDRLLQVLDQLHVKFTPSIFSNGQSRIQDDHLLRYITRCPPEDNSLDASYNGLSSLSSYSDPCKLDWNSLHDSSTNLWSSVHQLQSHADWGPMLGFMPNGSAGSDLVEDHHNLMLVQGLNNDILGTTDLSFFGSCSALDNCREAPMSSSDGITW